MCACDFPSLTADIVTESPAARQYRATPRGSNGRATLHLAFEPVLAVRGEVDGSARPVVGAVAAADAFLDTVSVVVVVSVFIVVSVTVVVVEVSVTTMETDALSTALLFEVADTVTVFVPVVASEVRFAVMLL